MRKWIAAHRKTGDTGGPRRRVGRGDSALCQLGAPPGTDLVQRVVLGPLYGGFLVRRHRSGTKDRGQARLAGRDSGLRPLPGFTSRIAQRDLEHGRRHIRRGRGYEVSAAVYDTLEPSGRPTTFCALAAASPEPRKIGRKERKYVTHSGCQAFRLTTEKGDIEVAARPDSLRKILDVIRQEEETG
jgi:hypothetical protein